MTRDPWTGLPLEPPETYTKYYARCCVCEEEFERDDMAVIFVGQWGVETPRGRCLWCPRPTEDEE